MTPLLFTSSGRKVGDAVVHVDQVLQPVEVDAHPGHGLSGGGDAGVGVTKASSDVDAAVTGRGHFDGGVVLVLVLVVSM